MSYDILQKVMKLVALTETVSEFYVDTMLSGSYAFLIDTNNHMNSIKLKDYMVEIVTDFCDAISTI